MNAAAILLSFLALSPRAAEAQGRPIAGAAESAAKGAYELKAQIPPAIRKGVVVGLILRVRKEGRPVDDLVCCLAALPLFPSVEDAMEAKVSGGIDLGTAPRSAVRTGCPDSIAGTMKGPGQYEFMWEPDTAGRVNLTFTVETSRLTVPVDVAGAPPNPAILAAFVVLVGAVVGTAAFLRRRHPRQA